MAYGSSFRVQGLGMSLLDEAVAIGLVPDCQGHAQPQMYPGRGSYEHGPTANPPMFSRASSDVTRFASGRAVLARVQNPRPLVLNPLGCVASFLNTLPAFLDTHGGPCDCPGFR